MDVLQKREKRRKKIIIPFINPSYAREKILDHYQNDKIETKTI